MMKVELALSTEYQQQLGISTTKLVSSMSPCRPVVLPPNTFISLHKLEHEDILG